MSLFVIFFLFLGQIGFLANAGQFIESASEMGASTAFATGTAKLTVGCVMIFVFMLLTKWSTASYTFISAAMVVGVLGLSYGNGIVVLTAAFFIYEVSFNIKSSVLLGDISDNLTGRMRQSILFVVMLGNLFSPVVVALAITSGHTSLTIVLAIVAILVAQLWRTGFLNRRA